MKKCSKCFQEKSLDCFHQYKTGRRAGTFWAECKECRYTRLRSWRKKNPEAYKEHYRRARYKTVYGLRDEDVPKVGDCILCGKEQVKLVVDHCHQTKKVRGFICYSCNTVLGHLENDSKMLNCLNYLLKNNSKALVFSFWDMPE